MHLKTKHFFTLTLFLISFGRDPYQSLLVTVSTNDIVSLNSTSEKE